MKIKEYIRKMLDILLPQKCLSCGKIGDIICETCLARLPRETSEYGISTIFPYSDPIIRKAIWLLKYKGVSEVVRPLARALHERLLEDISSEVELYMPGGEKVILIPAPLSQEREAERGYNQSSKLAETIIELDGGASFELRNDVLKKTRHTPSQVSIKNRAERIKNLKGAFSLGDEAAAIAGKIVAVIDDVTTTGTTLDECARALRRAKPRRIIKIALAH